MVLILSTEKLIELYLRTLEDLVWHLDTLANCDFIKDLLSCFRSVKIESLFWLFRNIKSVMDTLYFIQSKCN